jgi:hypothetical protein
VECDTEVDDVADTPLAVVAVTILGIPVRLKVKEVEAFTSSVL